MKTKKKKYFINHNYFEIIDTQEKAYILGLLYTDGYVNEKLGYVQLQLVEKDIHILEHINSLLIPDRKLRKIVPRKDNEFLEFLDKEDKYFEKRTILKKTNNKIIK